MSLTALALCCHFAARRHWLPKREGYPRAGRTAEWQVAQRALRSGTEGSPKWHRGLSDVAHEVALRRAAPTWCMKASMVCVEEVADARDAAADAYSAKCIRHTSAATGAANAAVG